MKPTDDLVREFHAHPGSGQPIFTSPIIPNRALVRHRLRLLEEEFKEVRAELLALLAGDLEIDQALEIMGNLLKELCDLRYVADGACLSLGLPYEDAYRAVHASNMSKRFPDGRFYTDGLGKVLKGPNYQPPDMRRFVPSIIDGEGIE